MFANIKRRNYVYGGVGIVIKSNLFEIQGHVIADDKPTYFIADIAANHDGNLERAIDLIYLAKEAGADAA